MYMLRQKIVKSVALDDNTTWRYKLPSLGKYTALEMRIQATRQQDRIATATNYQLVDCISKIELLAGGSRALLSLTGTQLDAVNYWAFGKPTPRRSRQVTGGANDLCLYLLGGRSLYDKQYGWDFARLPETYLEYTYDQNEGDAEYFTANTHYVTLYGWRWMDPGAPSFIGYFRNRQLAAWATTGADVLKNVELPIGNPYRWIGVQAKTRAQTIGGTLTNIELKVNNGEYSPVDIPSAMDWCMQEAVDYSLYNTVEGMDYVPAGACVDIPYLFSYYMGLLAQELIHTGGRVAPYTFITLPARVEEKLGTATEFAFSATGCGFQKCLRIGFDHDPDGYDLLHTAGMGALDLVLTEQTSAENAAVFAQDIVPF